LFYAYPQWFRSTPLVSVVFCRVSAGEAPGPKKGKIMSVTKITLHNRVTVYQAAPMLTQTGEAKTPACRGSREALELLSLKPVEGTGIEVDRSELDKNWLYWPKA
jgi:hypothetical protein